MIYSAMLTTVVQSTCVVIDHAFFNPAIRLLTADYMGADVFIFFFQAMDRILLAAPPSTLLTMIGKRLLAPLGWPDCSAPACNV
jgi:hypothetical protein